MLRVAFVLRSTEVHPAFCDLSPQCVCMRALIISYRSYMVWYGMCVYMKAFEAARSNNTAHHIAFDVLWCGTLGFESFFILANSIQPSLHGGFFACVCSAPYRARVLSSIHMWSTRISPTSFTLYRDMGIRCAANIYRQIVNFMTRPAA